MLKNCSLLKVTSAVAKYFSGNTARASILHSLALAAAATVPITLPLESISETPIGGMLAVSSHMRCIRLFTEPR